MLTTKLGKRRGTFLATVEDETGARNSFRFEKALPAFGWIHGWIWCPEIQGGLLVGSARRRHITNGFRINGACRGSIFDDGRQLSEDELRILQQQGKVMYEDRRKDVQKALKKLDKDLSAIAPHKYPPRVDLGDD